MIVHSSPLSGFAASRQITKAVGDLPDGYLRAVMKGEEDRFARFSLSSCGLLLDYSRHLMDETLLGHLMELADEAGLPAAIEAQMTGEPINTSEGRAALHSALRGPETDVHLNGQPLAPVIGAVRQQMAQICDDVHSGRWCSRSGKPMRHIVNIGIGGSYLGPKVVTDALYPFRKESITPHYIANIDPADISRTLDSLDPEQTLFIIASKTFTTLETLANARAVRAWLLDNGIAQSDLNRHLIAVTCNVDAAVGMGVDAKNVLPLWDWVGGRYSLWSAIGLIVALTVGYDRYEQLLAGAGDMDQHFRSAPLRHNMPVLMGMLGILYHHWFDAHSHAVISYDQGLNDLVKHLQQVDMESNGKSTTRQGQPVTSTTGPIIWGGVGTNDQHAYMQLLHQGTRTIPVDFVVPATTFYPVADQHDWLFANALAQANALACGRPRPEVVDMLTAQGKSPEQIESLASHMDIVGNRPCSLLLCHSLTPTVLGALLALYEQKTFVQSVIWNINPFDQWGVELGKELGQRIYPLLREGPLAQLDHSSRAVIAYFRQAQK